MDTIELDKSLKKLVELEKKSSKRYGLELKKAEMEIQKAKQEAEKIRVKGLEDSKTLTKTLTEAAEAELEKDITGIEEDAEKEAARISKTAVDKELIDELVDFVISDYV